MIDPVLDPGDVVETIGDERVSALFKDRLHPDQDFERDDSSDAAVEGQESLA
jgi:hypothetical protein